MSKKATARTEEKPDPHRQITPRVEDEGLFAFLEEDVFHLSQKDTEPGKPKLELDRFADRLTVRACHGVAGKDLGPVVFEREWKSTTAPLPSKETLVTLANQIIAKVRHDAQALGKNQIYSVLAYSNVKGANAVARYLLPITPGPKEYEERDATPQDGDNDANGTSIRSLLLELYKDRRFQQEHTARMFENYQSATVDLFSTYETRLSAAESVNQQLLNTHMEMIRLREELLDRSANRELRERKAQFWQAKIEQGMSLVEGLVPAVVAYMTKGTAGVREGVTAFAKSLDAAQRDALFGEWNGVQLVKPGVLSEEQAQLFGSVVEGKEAPSRVVDFIASLSMEQMASAQQILRQDQLVGLMAVADAVKKAANESVGVPGSAP